MTELLTQADIARRLGISRQRVHKLVHGPQYKFPAPTLVVGSRRAWSIKDVDDWKKNRPTLVSGPSKLV